MHIRLFIFTLLINILTAGVNVLTNRAIGDELYRIDFQIIDLPEINSVAPFEEGLNGSNKNSRPFQYGHKFDVDYSITNSGTWKVLENGTSLWRLGIRSNGAHALKLEFDKYWLPKEAELYIYNYSGNMGYGPFDSSNNHFNDSFGTPLIKGDLVVIEYLQPEYVTEQPQLRIKNVVHDYTDIFHFSDVNRDRDCGENVVCESAQEFRDQANAVIYLIINEYTCTGTLINNVNNDNTPYVLTAWHCIVGETNLEEHNNFVFYFNHESPTCEGNSGSFEYSVTGSTLLATRNENVGSDFALLLMDEPPPESWTPFYAGWSNDNEAPLISSGIHHPEDDPRKINYNDDYAWSCAWNSPNTHWCLSWDEGGTADGSSGSAIFNSNKQLVGNNTGSDGPDCSPGPDLYGKFSLSWNGGNNASRRLMDWLDPDNTGVVAIDGIYTNNDYDIAISNLTGWNLLGLPLEVEDDSYYILFPESIEGTLYSFDNGYNLETSLIQGEGYWLRFNEEGSTTISGLPINELTISLNEGWNLISGISTPFVVIEINDPDGIIISGTIYGFTSGGYSNAEILEPGKGYWIRANNSGYISFIDNSGLLPEECYLEPDVGPCDGVCPRYFYNQETEECEEFAWGCCEGLVPFDTLEECISTCE